jgi:hypothetical protein
MTSFYIEKFNRLLYINLSVHLILLDINETINNLELQIKITQYINNHSDSWKGTTHHSKLNCSTSTIISQGNN